MSDNFYIALCLHFHQPHFQLKNVRDQVFRRCYYPMLDMLEGRRDPQGALRLNFHVSGPLINYASRHEKDFLDRMKAQVDRGVVKIVGGLIDESFPQLSSRADDAYFQILRYGIATERFFGVPPSEWDGFHIVEREVGELLLFLLSIGLENLGALPLYYLDVETFFTPFQSEEENLSLKHFGVVDPALKSTMPYFSRDALFSVYRDEIMGRPFYVVPIHSELRYFLLKRRPIFGSDPTCTPTEYLDLIRKKAETARELIYKKSNKKIPPLIFIFNDAELFGQWSADPVGDRAWMEEFFSLVTESPETSFITLADYYKKFGYIDTYPVKTSTSYTEFESWTMKRGIRGVTFGDPKLRRVISCLRDLEKAQELVERAVLDRVNADAAGTKDEATLARVLTEEITQRVLTSRNRYDLIRVFMAHYYPSQVLVAYDLIHTIRNIAYQEDPRWASRHPNFGSCTYYDLTGLAYIAVANRLADYLLAEISRTWGLFPKETLEITDWDYDGNDEVVINTDQQFLVISKVAGTVIHHQIHSPYFKGMDFQKILSVAQSLVTEMPMFPATGFYSQCLIHTEPDSELCVTLEQDSRVEYCRDAYRANFITKDESGRTRVVGSFDYQIFDLVDWKIDGTTLIVTMEAEQTLSVGEGEELCVSLAKTFTVSEDRFEVTFTVTKLTDEDDPRWGEILFVPQLVNSVTPADDIDGRLESFIQFIPDGSTEKIALTYQVTTFPAGSASFSQHEVTETIYRPQEIRYALAVKTPLYGRFWDIHAYRFTDGTTELIEDIDVEPAVHTFYKGFVFESHSRLGYHQSGAKVSPVFGIPAGKVARYGVSLSREIREIGSDPSLFAGAVALIQDDRRKP
jgi:hypothetical protein